MNLHYLNLCFAWDRAKIQKINVSKIDKFVKKENEINVSVHFLPDKVSVYLNVFCLGMLN